MDHPSYWLPISEKEKLKVDEDLYNKFYSKDFITIDEYYTEKIFSCENPKSMIGYIIYFDQLLRHFQRHLQRTLKNDLITDEIIEKNRFILTKYINENIDFSTFNEEECMFALFPFKHTFEYDFVLDMIIDWTMGDISSFPRLSKFFNDTYKKEYTYQTVKECIDIIEPLSSLSFDPLKVCDFYAFPPKDIKYEKELELLKETIGDNKKVCVSLSGGVDSMTMLFLLSKLDVEVIACHLIYGNREESVLEFDIIRQFCTFLKIPLYYYKIEYLKRATIEREFYEEMTRNIRFFMYRMMQCPILLGHIQEDVIENVWTNFARGQHIFDLKKMDTHVIQDNIQLIRPFLSVEKKRMFDLAHQYNIPYLKNTTPSWCNRGKFRERFYEETHIQYGKQVDKKILEVATTLKQTNKLLNNLLYKPILTSLHDNKVDVTRAIEAELDVNGWSYIFTEICHTLGMNKPSIHAIQQFVQRISKYKSEKMKFQMKENLQVLFYKHDEKYYLEFVNTHNFF
jgi:tRNA(Ile)-lysidine synthetase-like protein